MNDGGPAFPWTSDERSLSGQSGSGMTLRDYFAAKAMGGLLTPQMCGEAYLAGDTRILLSALAKVSYLAADALLKERNTP